MMFMKIFVMKLSVCFTAIILRLFPANISVFSNTKSTSFLYFHSTAAVGISMLIMGIVFMISVSSKKYVAKVFEDVI